MNSGRRLATAVAVVLVMADPAVAVAQGAGPVHGRVERSACVPAAGPCPCGVPVKRITAVGRRDPVVGTVYRVVPLTLCVRLLDVTGRTAAVGG